MKYGYLSSSTHPPPPRKIKRESNSWVSLGQNSKHVIFNRLLGKRLILDPVKKSSSTNVLVREVCVLTIRHKLLKYQPSNLKYFLTLKNSLASREPQTVRNIEVFLGGLFVCLFLFVLSRYVLLCPKAGHRTITQINKNLRGSCLIHSYQETLAWTISKVSLSCPGMCWNPKWTPVIQLDPSPHQQRRLMRMKLVRVWTPF